MAEAGIQNLRREPTEDAMSNSAYLKEYVRMHPDNRMAWYLLGKEYEQSGQEGKANYCYIQAGNVYEAFESSKTPDEVWKEYAAELLAASKRKAASRTRWRRALAALMLLLLVLSAPLWTEAPGVGQAADGGGQEDSVIASAAAPSGKGNQGTAKQKKGPLFTAAAAGSAEQRAEALAGLLQTGSKQTGSQLETQTVMLGMESLDGWLLWKRDLPLEYSVLQDAGSGKTSIQALNPASCGCEPPEDSSSVLKSQAAEWTGEQELLAVLSSAIEQFKEAEGRYPGKLGELNQPYPNNWIAGDAPEAGPAFQTALAQAKSQTGQSAASKAETGASVTAGEQTAAPGEPFFQQPLEIKIDKSRHLLALVSGKVVLRTYQVGLGGDRTPEGTFRITEKVMHPNGHDDGEFGSRGMALSGGNYAIHGTNEPDSIGKDESKGCIRMAKADVEELFDMVPKGTSVTIGKGILPDLKPGTAKRFEFPDRQDQRNPRKTYHWLD
ncbi:L,D-transpeptidase [Paenibacillus pinistramenti]|uniref:L,D-transpeptidase n=1 Tax=Paenibacillus pinistramenti TaxID=1768003 RepID=UPI001EF0B6EE|nr:L,D-transpeptidase [Paenibacillus pinistramenti]